MTAVVAPRGWAQHGPSGVRRFVPILGWLPAYALIGEDHIQHTIDEAVQKEA